MTKFIKVIKAMLIKILLGIIFISIVDVEQLDITSYRCETEIIHLETCNLKAFHSVCLSISRGFSVQWKFSAAQTEKKKLSANVHLVASVNQMNGQGRLG